MCSLLPLIWGHEFINLALVREISVIFYYFIDSIWLMIPHSLIIINTIIIDIIIFISTNTINIAIVWMTRWEETRVPFPTN